MKTPAVHPIISGVSYSLSTGIDASVQFIFSQSFCDC